MIKNKEKILNEIKDKGYSNIGRIYTNKEINNIKSQLLRILHYIHPKKINNLQKKYFQVKKFNLKLKGNFFDLLSYEINTLKLLHKKEIINIVKKYFNTQVIFSGRPNIHIHDFRNERFLEPHQELNQFAKDFLFIWAPLFDANEMQGGLCVYEGSHRSGYYKHFSNNKLRSSHVKKKIYSNFPRKDIKLKAGSVVMMHSALIHGTLVTKKKNFAKFVMVDRFNPLKKIPYLRDVNKPMKIPHFGVDYNLIRD